MSKSAKKPIPAAPSPRPGLPGKQRGPDRLGPGQASANQRWQRTKRHGWDSR